ncbi:MAG: hypothetical protein LBN08_02310 [Lactobacillales bacterium]|nr:hypothetical protein [Lactobacillales bacterium]
MKKVFISGSRNINHLPETVSERIDNIISANLEVVVGDSEKGVDALIIKDFASRRYPDVTIYTIHNPSRVKDIELKEWDTNLIVPETSKNGKEAETFKDRAMGDVADYGLVIWQDTYIHPRFKKKSVSSGSLRNMVQLLLRKKPVELYYKNENWDEFSHFELRAIDDLEFYIKEQMDELTFRTFEKILKAEEKQFDTKETLDDRSNSGEDQLNLGI